MQEFKDYSGLRILQSWIESLAFIYFVESFWLLTANIWYQTHYSHDILGYGMWNLDFDYYTLSTSFDFEEYWR